MNEVTVKCRMCDATAEGRVPDVELSQKVYWVKCIQCQCVEWDAINQPDPIDDGHGNRWSPICPTCKGHTMHIVRPGKAQCEVCG